MELHYADIVRARSTLLIMRNVIPGGLEYPEVRYYCTWHPHLASETNHDLAPCYPEMRYHVGCMRAASYVSGHKDLGLLPNVSIAEEA